MPAGNRPDCPFLWRFDVFRLRFRLTVAAFAGVVMTAIAQTPPAAPPVKPAAPAPAVVPPAAPAPAVVPPAAPAPAVVPPAAPAPAVVPAPAPAAPASDKQKFEFKLEKDKAFYQEISTIVTQTIQVMNGSDLVQKHEQVFYFKWLPTAQTGEKWLVKQTIEGVKMTIDIAGNQVKYDSTNPSDTGATGNPGLADFFGKLVGSEFTITFGKGMVVEKVDGTSDFLKKLGGVNAQMEKLLSKMLTDEAMKQMTDPTFGMTPAAEQAIGGTWEKKTSMSLGPIGSYDMTAKYTYKGKDAVKKDLERVELSSNLAYKPPVDQAEGLLFKIKGGTLTTEEPKPDAKPNFFLYNAKTGRIEESSIAVKLRGTLDVTIGGADTKINLHQEQTTTSKTADKSFLPDVKKPN